MRMLVKHIVFTLYDFQFYIIDIFLYVDSYIKR